MNKIFLLTKWVAKLVFKKVKHFSLFPYFLVRSSWPIWLYLNRKSRQIFLENKPILSESDQRLVFAIKEKGIVVTSLDDLFPGRPFLLSELQHHAHQFLATAGIKKGKTYLKEAWPMPPLLDLDNPFVKLALDQKLINIVNTYLEMYARFHYFTLALTMPMPQNAEAVKSQRWHRDPDDKKMCKIFIYLNDVSDGSGPFIYIPGSHYGGRWGNIFPQRPPKGYYPPAGQVEKIIPVSEVKTLTGRAGTVIFCDTAGLHKGGYAVSGERIMFTAGYSSHASLWPRQFRYPDNFEKGVESLNRPVQYALRT